MYLSHRQTTREITKKIAYTFEQAENLSKRVVQASQTKRRHGGAMQLQRLQTRTGTYNSHTQGHKYRDKWHGKEECRNTSWNVSRRRQLKSIVWESEKVIWIIMTNGEGIRLAW